MGEGRGSVEGEGEEGEGGEEGRAEKQKGWRGNARGGWGERVERVRESVRVGGGVEVREAGGLYLADSPKKHYPRR
jgi:hypothetical protein